MGKFLDKAGLQHYNEKIKAYIRLIAGSKVQQHENRTDNPHLVTKEKVGLGNVTNDAQIPLSQKGAASGVATLDANGMLIAGQLPAMKTVNGVSVVGYGNISIDLSLYKVVDSLPTTGIDATKIYIVPAKTTGDKNIKAEYVYTGNPASTYDASKWEKLGEAQTNIVVDAELNAKSTNPVQNKVIYDRFTSLSDIYVPMQLHGQQISAITNKIAGLESENADQDKAIAACVKKTDLVAITNEEIDAMF